MPINRKILARPIANPNKRKYLVNKEISHRTNELADLCTKHKVGPLTSFKSCKLAGADGSVTYVGYKIIKANMRSGVIIIQANKLVRAPDVVYDIVQIEKDKRERDEKKAQEDAEKAKMELERIQSNNSKLDLSILPEGSEQHKNLLMKLVAETEPKVSENGTNLETTTEPLNEPITEPVNEPLNEPVNEPFNEPVNEPLNELVNEPITEPVNEPITELVNEPLNEPVNEPLNEPVNEPEDETVGEPTKSSKRDKSIGAKRQKALEQMKDEISKKMNPNERRNKFYRNFMKDLRDKFTIIPQPEYKFLDMKAETTDMIIDRVVVYKIEMPAKISQTYLLAVGDLQLKSKFIQQIDPAYKADRVVKEQNEFLERIRAKENAKITEAKANILEDEDFADIDQLGLSDDDETKSEETKSEETTESEKPENSNGSEIEIKLDPN